MRFVIVLALFISMPSYAHLGCCHGPNDGKDRPQFVAEEVFTDGQMAGSQIIELVVEGHDALEPQDHAVDTRYMTWPDWGVHVMKQVPQKLDPENIRNLVLNAYRYYAAHRETPEMANSASNAVIMLLTSHTLEIVGGFDLASIGAGQESVAAQAGLTAIGAGIAAFDPLCIILMAAYTKWPHTMNRVLTVPRLFLVSGAAAGLSVAGAPVPFSYVRAKVTEQFKNLFIRRLRAKMRDQGIEIRALTEEQAVYRVFDGSGEHVDLEFHLDPATDTTYLKSLDFSSTRIYGESLRRNLTPFGVSIRDLVFDVIYGYPTSAKYIESNSIDDEGRRYVRVQRGAFPAHVLRDSECQALLAEQSL